MTRETSNPYQRHVKAVKAQAAAWNSARAQADWERDKLRRVIIAAVEDGPLSEYTAATEAGVARATIRQWLGK